MSRGDDVGRRIHRPRKGRPIIASGGPVRPAILFAGQADPAEGPTALTVATGQPRKALLTLRGRPMLSYVAEALSASGCVGRLVVVGLSGEDAPASISALPITYLPDRGAMIANALSALDILDTEDHVLFASSDIPLLSAEAVCDFVARSQATGADLCYPAVRREVMEARFPGSGRSFRHLVEGDMAGGDLFFARPAVLRKNAALVQRLSASRKAALGLARLLGPGILLRFALRRLRIADLERGASAIFGCSCRAIISPYAELAMDVDHPKHLDVVLRAMGERDDAADHAVAKEAP
jgi:CTP:molybdopterin cytidylyltransferase MocA